MGLIFSTPNETNPDLDVGGSWAAFEIPLKELVDRARLSYTKRFEFDFINHPPPNFKVIGASSTPRTYYNGSISHVHVCPDPRISWYPYQAAYNAAHEAFHSLFPNNHSHWIIEGCAEYSAMDFLKELCEQHASQEKGIKQNDQLASYYESHLVLPITLEKLAIQQILEGRSCSTWKNLTTPDKYKIVATIISKIEQTDSSFLQKVLSVVHASGEDKYEQQFQLWLNDRGMTEAQFVDYVLAL